MYIENQLLKGISMSKQVKVKLFRKVTDTADISCRIQSDAFETRVIDVQKTVEFDPGRYGDFCWQLLAELDCLGDLDYSNNVNTPTAVEITCKGQRSLYVVPEGFNYARYLGIDDRKDESIITVVKVYDFLKDIDKTNEQILCEIASLADTDYTPEHILAATHAAKAMRTLQQLLADTHRSADDNPI